MWKLWETQTPKRPGLQKDCFTFADPSVRAVCDVGLRPFACWECGFESCWRHGRLCLVSVVLSERGLCVGLITRPEESNRIRFVWVWFWILDNEEGLAHWGLSSRGGRDSSINYQHRICAEFKFNFRFDFNTQRILLRDNNYTNKYSFPHLQGQAVTLLETS
jgi:hypothetical protein